jgi:hypothetical protein
MPIVYVHGVANRLDDEDQLPGWDEVSAYLRRYIAPEISDLPEGVSIKRAYWGDYGAIFRWSGASRPRSKLLGQGAGGGAADQGVADLGGLTQLPAVPPTSSSASALTSGRNAGQQGASTFRLRNLSSDELSNFLSASIEKVESRSSAQAAKIAADEVAHDPSVLEQLQRAPDLDTELAILQAALIALHAVAKPLAGQGAGSSWKGIIDRAREVAVRVNSVSAYAVSRLAMEARGPINDAVTTFIGDVFAYLSQKDSNPGPIRQVVLDTLQAARDETADKGEPMIVLSHSMGGQIVFDVATNYLGPNLRIDLWAAAASQVGLFEEMKLLLASDPAIRGPVGRAAFPPNVGWWWNVWDSNDVLSFTAEGIFDRQVNDEEWDSGASLAAAHGAYLKRPSFYRKLAEKIRTAQEINFNRP